MIDNSCVTLENGKEYIVADKIAFQNIFYIYLVNTFDTQDFCVRKEIEENDKTFLIGLENQEEADLALKLFYEKHQND